MRTQPLKMSVVSDCCCKWFGYCLWFEQRVLSRVARICKVGIFILLSLLHVHNDVHNALANLCDHCDCYNLFISSVKANW